VVVEDGDLWAAVLADWGIADWGLVLLVLVLVLLGRIWGLWDEHRYSGLMQQVDCLYDDWYLRYSLYLDYGAYYGRM
jgi:hypothetical protein